MNEQADGQLTLFPEDSPASLFPWQESKKEKGTTVTYGRRCSELSGSLRRVGLSVKTYLESCALPPGTWSRTWSVKGLTSSCLILKLRLSEHGTGGSESHLWPTATVEDAARTGSAEAWKQYEKTGKTTGYRLRNWVQNIENKDGQPKLWKTPVAADGANREFYHNSRGEPNLSGMVKPWPAPKARDGHYATGKEKRDSPDLNVVVKMFPTPRAQSAKSPRNPEDRQAKHELQTVAGGQLNPDWVEWLMGFPIGWTSLPESHG